VLALAVCGGGAGVARARLVDVGAEFPAWPAYRDHARAAVVAAVARRSAVALPERAKPKARSSKKKAGRAATAAAAAAAAPGRKRERAGAEGAESENESEGEDAADRAEQERILVELLGDGE
jgi:hypothetical protein